MIAYLFRKLHPVDIAQNCLEVIDENIALDDDNVFAKIGDVQKTAILLFAEYIDAATTIAAQSGGGGGGATSGWGRVTRTRMNCLGRIAAL